MPVKLCRVSFTIRNDKVPTLLEALSGEIDALELHQIDGNGNDASRLRSKSIPSTAEGRGLELRKIAEKHPRGFIISMDDMRKYAMAVGYNKTSYVFCGQILVNAGVVKALGRGRGWERI